MIQERRLRLLDDVEWYARHYQQGYEPRRDDATFLGATACEVVGDPLLAEEKLRDACAALVIFRRKRKDIAQGAEYLRLALAR